MDWTQEVSIDEIAAQLRAKILEDVEIVEEDRGRERRRAGEKSHAEGT